MPSINRKFGDLGEKVACYYLSRNNYRVIDRNYRRPWGEIDIICRKDDLLIFCEVKTRDLANVKHYLAEFSVNSQKIKKLQKICESYLIDKKIPYNQKWQIDVIAIAIDKSTGKAKINHIRNAVWEKLY